jgi:hypothetical protein
VTREALDFVERGEAIVRQFGFKVFRVRYLPPVESSTSMPSRPGAKVQISQEEMNKLPAVQSVLIAALSASGFGAVGIDPEPLKR